MSVGAYIRSIAGPYERTLCALYRRPFINLRRVAAQLSPRLPQSGMIVDVGGGDGEMVNHLLRMCPGRRITMIDMRGEVGRFIDDDVRDRVKLLPNTSLADYAASGREPADGVLVSDVVHHIPEGEREAFFRDAAAILKPRGPLVVKEIEPRGVVAWLALLTDKHVSGDKAVSQIPGVDLVKLVERVTGMRAIESPLSWGEKPNYAIVFIGR